ncbi:MAG TPA: TRAP transporter large permease subunit [Azoarcus taiwanensis]|nr:TRAP transporter large permease subunit [Azoarcus taiwanensis]
MDLSAILVLSMFATFITLLMTGFPVAWVLAATALIFAGVGHVAVEYFDADLWFRWDSTIGSMPFRIWQTVSNELLVALPMFTFMGVMLDRSGIAERLMSSLVRLFGRIRGGYAVTVIVVGVLLAATTGIIGASVVLLGMLSLAPMLRNGYSKELAVGTACATGTLGILIPPSIMLVLMASQINRPEASVGNLFMGALIPGLMLGALYVIYVLVLAWLRPNRAPVPADAPKVDWRVILDVARAAVPPAMLILAVLGSIFFGYATTTEASGVGALGALLLALFNGRLSWVTLGDALRETTRTTAFIFAIFIGAMAFAAVLRGLGGDDVIHDALNALPFGPTGVLIIILAVTFLLGFFLDWVEISLIVLPLVAPVVHAMGFDLLWFTIMFAVCLQTSFLTPPVGFALFYIKGVCPPGVTTAHIYRGVVPFIIIQLVALALIFNFEQIVTWLPAARAAGF